MGKERKKRSCWEILLRGCLLACGIYLAGIALLALLMVKGALPESGMLSALGILCVLAGLCGGLPVVRGTPWGRVPAGIISGAAFVCVLLITGACIWQGSFSWSESGVLLACGQGGGVVAAFLGGRKRRVGKRLRK